jgi:hypothetical protein
MSAAAGYSVWDDCLARVYELKSFSIGGYATKLGWVSIIGE